MGKAEANLREEVDRLKDVNGSLCAEINRQEKRIRDLECLVRDFDLTAIEYVRKHDVSETVRSDEAYWWAKTHIRQRIKELGL